MNLTTIDTVLKEAEEHLRVAQEFHNRALPPAADFLA